MKINIKEMYTKNKEVINYLIFGFLTFAVSMVTYYLSRLIFDYVVSNIISWILAVLFAYITNKLFKRTYKWICKIHWRKNIYIDIRNFNPISNGRFNAYQWHDSKINSTSHCNNNKLYTK